MRAASTDASSSINAARPAWPRPWNQSMPQSLVPPMQQVVAKSSPHPSGGACRRKESSQQLGKNEKTEKIGDHHGIVVACTTDGFGLTGRPPTAPGDIVFIITFGSDVKCWGLPHVTPLPPHVASHNTLKKNGDTSGLASNCLTQPNLFCFVFLLAQLKYDYCTLLI